MMTDLRFAVRMLVKAPIVTSIAIITLALGIGANSSIFSVVYGVLFRPLPLQDPEQIVQVWESKSFPAGFRGTASPANIKDWQEQNTVFSGLAAYKYRSFALQGKSDPARVLGASVSANYFSVLGARPIAGRTFVAREDEENRSSVALIADGLWRSRFSADPKIVGRIISLDGRPFTIIGVMPAAFSFPASTVQLWTPLVLSPSQQAARSDHDLQVVGRVRPGVTLRQAQAQMNVIAEGIALRFPDEQGDRGVLLIPLREQLTMNSRAALLVLFTAVGCVLLIATANVANLLLARTASRVREVALRLALGASRARLFRQFLTESVLLAAIGGALGILLAGWGTKLLVSLLGNRIAMAGQIHLDPNVVFFTALISMAVGVVAGLAPARYAMGQSAMDLQTQLRGHTAVAGANRLRNLLVITEIALAALLLTGAGLLLRSLAELQRTESGLGKPEQVLTARISLPPERYASSQAMSDFYRRLFDRVNALPSVAGAGAINFLPLDQWGWNTDLELEGRTPFPPHKAPLVELRAVAGDYFPAIGVPLLAGRLLDPRDGLSAPRATVINRTLALIIADSEAQSLGQKIKLDQQAFTVVGVVGDVRQRGLDYLPAAEMYFSVAQAPGSEASGSQLAQSMTVVLRASTQSPTSLADGLRRAVLEIDPGLPLFRVQTLETVITQSLSDRRTNGFLLGSFATVALILAAIGLYGVLSYAVAQRTRELGIRLALGAQRADIFRLIVSGGMKIAGLGLAIGLLAALIVTRLLRTLLYGVAPTDPATFAIVAVLLGAIAFLANYVPAYRAMKVNPTVALRYE